MKPPTIEEELNKRPKRNIDGPAFVQFSICFMLSILFLLLSISPLDVIGIVSSVVLMILSGFAITGSLGLLGG